MSDELHDVPPVGSRLCAVPYGAVTMPACASWADEGVLAAVGRVAPKMEKAVGRAGEGEVTEMVVEAAALLDVKKAS